VKVVLTLPAIDRASALLSGANKEGEGTTPTVQHGEKVTFFVKRVVGFGA